MKATTLGIVPLLAILLGANTALADPPPSNFTLDFTGDSAIWNPFDGFLACESAFGATLCLSVDDVACNGKGNCTGISEFDFSGSVSGLTTGPARAKAICNATVNENSPVCKAVLGFDTAGVVRNCDTTIKGSVRGPVDSTGFFSGKGWVKVCLACPGERRRCAGGRGLFEYAVNPPTPWSVTVQIVQNENKLEGTATDSLGYSYVVKGLYNARKDESKIILKGEPNTASQGAKIAIKNLTAAGASVTGGTAIVKVQGNRSRARLAP